MYLSNNKRNKHNEGCFNNFPFTLMLMILQVLMILQMFCVFQEGNNPTMIEFYDNNSLLIYLPIKNGNNPTMIKFYDNNSLLSYKQSRRSTYLTITYSITTNYLLNNYLLINRWIQITVLFIFK